jgi:hypothetical protein
MEFGKQPELVVDDFGGVVEVCLYIEIEVSAAA